LDVPESFNNTAAPASTLLLGCDFSSAPNAKKQIVLAIGALTGGRVQLLKLERLTSLASFASWLQVNPNWLGAFDLPFGLPRELVQVLGWPEDWQSCIAHFASLSRDQIRAEFAAFCNARPAGGKFAHRATDRVALSSPSMKWVNPPVAFMLHAGVPILLASGAFFPGLQTTPPQKHLHGKARVALEAYPGMLARQVLGSRSYKADDRSRQTPERLIARKDLIHALERGATHLGLRLKLTHAQRDALADDPTGDALDATLCLMQAAWAQARHDAGDTNYGLPADLDPLEGWIVTA
jgi:hypothetical protein